MNAHLVCFAQELEHLQSELAQLRLERAKDQGLENLLEDERQRRLLAEQEMQHQKQKNEVGDSQSMSLPRPCPSP